MIPVLEARNIHKRYEGSHALRGVDFALRPGEIRALIGANGAGKSTLCRIVAGIESPDDGEILVGGVPVEFSSVRDAAAAGIEMVHQELSLFPELSIVENLFLGAEITDRFGLISVRVQKQIAAKALARLGYSLDLDMRLAALPLGLRQIVEIAKALIHETSILLLDEPTSALSHAEISGLFDVIRSMAAQGMAIVYISHRLEELLAISESVTVMRDGLVVATDRCDRVDSSWIVQHMTGRAYADEGQAPAVSTGAPLMVASNLNWRADRGQVGLRDLSMDVSAGEIVGIYGFMGAGRTELLQVLMGLHSEAEGSVRMDGVDLRARDVADRTRLGIFLVPEDRQREGLVPTLSVLSNMTLACLPKFGAFRLDHSGELAAATALVAALQIKLSSLEQSILSLSGGNQQKVVLSRCLMAGPRLLMLDEPCRGVDVAAKADILNQMRLLAQSGMAVIFVTSDAAELLSVATRVVVMARGRIVLNAPAQPLTEEQLTLAASTGMQSPVSRVAS